MTVPEVTINTTNTTSADTLYIRKPTYTRVIPLKPVPVVKSIGKTRMKCLKESDLPKKEQINNGIKMVAERTGVSEQYLSKVLLKEEKLSLRVYDDGVKENKDDPHGTYTIGYGHTGTVPGWFFEGLDYDDTKEYPITEENKDFLCITIPMAFELLVRDVEKAKNDAIEFMGEENFEKAPQSIQDAIVDIVFNKGTEKAFINNPNSPTYHLKQDLEDEDYKTAALNTIYKTSEPGLRKRGLIRFLHALNDLSKEDIKENLDAIRVELNQTRYALYQNTGILGPIRLLYFDMRWAEGISQLNAL